MNDLTETSYATLSYPDIKVGSLTPVPLASRVMDNLAWVTVEMDLNRSDMFEIAFLDPDGTITSEAGVSIGTPVEIWAADTKGTSLTKRLIAGEVTSLEAICDEGVYTIFRGYDLSHRLQRGRSTRTFMGMSDADIARKIATAAGLRPPHRIEPSVPVHQHIAQVAQTDWDFLQQRAQEIGYETGVDDGTFFFRKTPIPKPGGKAASRLAALEAEAAGRTLSFGQNLLMFRPRVSGANMTSEVEVRVWDPYQGTVVVAKAPTRTSGISLDEQPDQLAKALDGGFALPSAPTPPKPGIGGKTAPVPSTDALVVVDLPVGEGVQATAAANMAARSIAERLGSDSFDAEGLAHGDPDIRPGVVFSVDTVPDPFVGGWRITRAEHVFDNQQGGYRTRFYASGSQDRSLLSLMAPSDTQQPHQQIRGLVCGVVTNVLDLMRQKRVKLSFPWLDPHYESDWARVVQIAAGPRSGAMFLPEVGDEVLVGFEFGDLRRPYVLGGIINRDSTFDIGGYPIKSMGAAAEVVWRGFADPAGNKISFHSELPPRSPNAPAVGGLAGAPPVLSEIVLGTVDEALVLSINETTGMVTLKADPKMPRSQNPKGTITIDAGAAGIVQVKTGPGGQVTVDSGIVNVTSKTTLTVESTGPVQIKGNPVQIN